MPCLLLSDLVVIALKTPQGPRRRRHSPAGGYGTCRGAGNGSGKRSGDGSGGRLPQHRSPSAGVLVIGLSLQLFSLELLVSNSLVRSAASQPRKPLMAMVG